MAHRFVIRPFLRAFSGVVLGFALTACQSAPVPKHEPLPLPASQEPEFATTLNRNIQDTYGKVTDKAILGFLDGMVGKLRASTQEVAAAIGPVTVEVLQTEKPFVAPGLGNRIFLSLGLLRAVEYENELAFLMGSQLALLRDRAVQKRLGSQPEAVSANWFEAGGLFDFGVDPYLNAEKDGIRLIHSAKYDPRGAVTFIQRWNQQPRATMRAGMGKIMPEPEERLQSARDEVAKLSPLRDPIVKSKAFEGFKAKVRRTRR